MREVPSPRNKRSLWIAVLGLLALIIFISAFVPVQQTIRGACVIDPAERWTLREVRQGSYESKTIDLASGLTRHYRLYQFDRPAFLEFDLSQIPAGSQNGHEVSSGDIVARMKSSSLDIEFAERFTALQMAKGRLEAMQGGERPEEIEHAQLALRRAEAEREGFRPQYDRQLRLWETGDVSEHIWEETKAQMDLLELDVELAQAELRVLSSDDRPAKIAEAQRTIDALEQELTTVQRMVAAQEIPTPIAGRLRPGSDGVTLVSVSKLENMIAQILIPQRQAQHITDGQRFKAYIPGIESASLEGTVIRVDRRATPTELGAFVTAYGSLDNSAGELEEGLQGHARIYCGRGTLLDRVWRDIVRALREELWPA